MKHDAPPLLYSDIDEKAGGVKPPPREAADLAPPLPEIGEPYLAYSYSYPHKSAYGPLKPPVALGPHWQLEPRSAMFLYVHLPFCEMRCGFCNLFARAGADDGLLDTYLHAIDQQARVLSEATSGDRSISRLAMGGGTPTFLKPGQLDRLFTILEERYDVNLATIPTSVETSPKTATRDRLSVLRARGVSRLSLGVQSFSEDEVHAIGRPQLTAEVYAAIDEIRSQGFPVLNIDLIYGQPSQTLPSWLASIRSALRFQPEELYLYPLYVRPETGLARRGDQAAAVASFCRDCYRAARDVLLAEGYEQRSMRYFRRADCAAEPGPTYCCQTDGMLGLGCGARSYTQRLHYSSRFAVASAGVHAILNDWMQQTDQDHGHARWGIWLTDDQRRRRYAIQSLLSLEGLDARAFLDQFGDAPERAIPELATLIDRGLATRDAWRIRLGERAVELSDAIGPALYSPSCRAALASFTQR